MRLQVVGVTDSMVAVNKPATLPVHASGQYRWVGDPNSANCALSYLLELHFLFPL